MTRYVQKTNFDITQVDDEWIILNPDKFTVTTLNQVAGFCWNLVREPQTVEAIIDGVQNNYLLPKESIKDDINAFLFEMMKLDLIKHEY